MVGSSTTFAPLGPIGRRERLSLEAAESLIELEAVTLGAASLQRFIIIRGLIRSQLLGATEEIGHRRGELFAGYSVSTFERDGIIGLTASQCGVTIIFPQGLPNGFAGLGGIPGHKESEWTFPGPFPEELHFKVMLRELRREARPRLPNGRAIKSYRWATEAIGEFGK